jgi:hypothetical protein
VVGEQLLYRGSHVDMVVAGRPAGHLPQRDEVGAGDTRNDTLKIVSAVKTEPVLYVIAHELHDNL